MTTGRDASIIRHREKVADYKAGAQAQHEPCNLVPAHRTLPLPTKCGKNVFRTAVMILDQAPRRILFCGFLPSLFYIRPLSSRISSTNALVIGSEI